MPEFASDGQTHTLFCCTGKRSKNHLESLDSRILFLYSTPEGLPGALVSPEHPQSTGLEETQDLTIPLEDWGPPVSLACL